MNNFDFLRDEPRFAAFAGVAISAERIILIDPDVCILNCRRAMEFAIKWIYSVETSLETPYQDNLHSLLNSEDFRDYVGNGDDWIIYEEKATVWLTITGVRDLTRLCFAWRICIYLWTLFHVVMYGDMSRENLIEMPY